MRHYVQTVLLGKLIYFVGVLFCARQSPVMEICSRTSIKICISWLFYLPPPPTTPPKKNNITLGYCGTNENYTQTRRRKKNTATPVIVFPFLQTSVPMFSFAFFFGARMSKVIALSSHKVQSSKPGYFIVLKRKPYNLTFQVRTFLTTHTQIHFFYSYFIINFYLL